VWQRQCSTAYACMSSMLAVCRCKALSYITGCNQYGRGLHMAAACSVHCLRWYMQRLRCTAAVQLLQSFRVGPCTHGPLIGRSYLCVMAGWKSLLPVHGMAWHR
jgi:hypothetical protein